MAEIQCSSKLFQVLINLSGSLSQGSFFKALYEMSNKQLFFQSAMYLTFYQLKFGKKIMLKQIVSSIDKIYHLGFPKAVVSKCSTKGTMSSSFSFRRAPYSCLLSEKYQRKFYFQVKFP